ncbi:VOC family protein [Brucella cytisi]|uniref:VOC family protein n=1 Tax=Brucella cytisi TaxID=407152 RepID=UPI0035DEED4B
MVDIVHRLHHVGVVVNDLQASLDWYRDKLGFEHQYSFTLPGTQAAMLVRGEARLEIFQVEGAAPMASEREDIETLLKRGGVNHFALNVRELEETIAALAAKGVEIVIPPSSVPNNSGDRFAYIRDNDRMLVELFQPAS